MIALAGDDGSLFGDVPNLLRVFGIPKCLFFRSVFRTRRTIRRPSSVRRVRRMTLLLTPSFAALYARMSSPGSSTQVRFSAAPLVMNRPYLSIPRFYG